MQRHAFHFSLAFTSNIVTKRHVVQKRSRLIRAEFKKCFAVIVWAESRASVLLVFEFLNFHGSQYSNLNLHRHSQINESAFNRFPANKGSGGRDAVIGNRLVLEVLL